MERDDYRKYTIYTLNGYPLKYRKHLRSLFVSAGIAQESGQLSFSEPTAVDISEYDDLDKQLLSCIENDDKSLAIFEKWEFTKDYKYSVLFDADDFDRLYDLVSKNIPDFGEMSAPLFDVFINPRSLTHSDSIFLIKFNLKFEAIHPQTSEELLVRYPVVVALHKNEKIVEIRFDALKRFFMEKSDSFYAKLVEDVCHYFQEKFQCKLTPLDMNFLIKRAQDDMSDVRLIAQTMKMANGSYAQLEVGKNEEYVLPFIGELKNILSEYGAEFEKVPPLKEAFEQFIFEKETTSDYPWIELLWENEIKTRSIHVKFTFNYYQKGYCLLQHYFNNTLIGMERMDHVVKFIDETRRNPQ